jgi:hypothetical protein
MRCACGVCVCVIQRSRVCLVTRCLTCFRSTYSSRSTAMANCSMRFDGRDPDKNNAAYRVITLETPTRTTQHIVCSKRRKSPNPNTHTHTHVLCITTTLTLPINHTRVVLLHSTTLHHDLLKTPNHIDPNPVTRTPLQLLTHTRAHHTTRLDATTPHKSIG